MKFRAHETFFIRKGWLHKGLKNVRLNNRIFSDKDIKPTDILGIGSNMVKSLRYWLQAVGLTEERNDGNLRYQELTSLGNIIWENDKYIEEDGTLWVLHYKLSSNKELATAWYWFYNEFGLKEFTKDDFVDAIDGYIRFGEEGNEVARGSLEDDYNCIINTYISKRKTSPDKDYPENNIDCPFGDLNLVDIVDKKRKVLRKQNIGKDSINPLIVLAIIIDQLNTQGNNYEIKEVKISELLNNPCNIGRTFNMDLSLLDFYLDKLQEMSYLKVIRTAGLDVIRLNTELDFYGLLNKYYEEINSIGLREENEQ
jgi:hypothetical protein